MPPPESQAGSTPAAGAVCRDADGTADRRPVRPRHQRMYFKSGERTEVIHWKLQS